MTAIGSSFPLYKCLLDKASEIELTYDEKCQLLLQINRLNQPEQEYIFAVIYIHSKRTGEVFEELPYNAVRSAQNNNDLIFSLNEFPPVLQRMLYNFATMEIDQ